jgi:pimeloyl-ACP methyl ester carboxylesterase
MAADSTITQFKIEIPQAQLDDLAYRLEHARWPADFGNEDWSYGANRAYLEQVVEYWLTEFDWREQERQMNRFDHFRVEIDEVPIHFIHARGKGPNPTPIILTHGYPMTFWDFNKIIEPLTDPEAYGRSADESFDVIVPSLPGYGFSSPLRKTGVNFVTTADLWVKLMRDTLGYERFGAHGGDWGTMVTSAMGHKYPDELIGVHLSMVAPMEIWGGEPLPGPEAFAADEAGLYERNAEKVAEAASHTSGTHILDPQTQAYGLHDSPIAQLAWMTEIRRAWSDCGGDIESRFTKDELITQTAIYWLTETYVTAARYYAEAARNPWKSLDGEMPVVKAPTGLSLFPHEVFVMPKSWDERYYNLKSLNHLPTGGHFTAMEEPELLSAELASFFTSLREAG